MKQGLTDLFSGTGADFNHDPASIRLIEDRVLVRDLPDEEERRIGSIIVPETAKSQGVGKNGEYRLGVVVAVGPGDKFIELSAPGNVASYAWGDAVRRRAITQECPRCHGKQPERCCNGDECACRGLPIEPPCETCQGNGVVPVVVPPQVQPGDKVIYEVRKHERVYLNGVPHFLMHCDQAIVAVVEG